MTRFWSALPLALALTGCPREVNEPDPPAGAVACESDVDCNEEPDGGVLCGLVAACVAGYCEATPSRVVPCAQP